MQFLKKILVFTTLLALIAWGLSRVPVREWLYGHLLIPLVSGQTPYWEVGHLGDKRKETRIFDVRSKKEFEVSHLPGAELIAYNTFHPDSLPANVQVSDTLLLYCSVGYRSDLVGQQLKDAGFLHVYNLRGGMFLWANKGRKLVDEDLQPANQVHPFDWFWGFWLWGAPHAFASGEEKGS